VALASTRCHQLPRRASAGTLCMSLRWPTTAGSARGAPTRAASSQNRPPLTAREFCSPLHAPSWMFLPTTALLQRVTVAGIGRELAASCPFPLSCCTERKWTADFGHVRFSLIAHCVCIHASSTHRIFLFTHYLVGTCLLAAHCFTIITPFASAHARPRAHTLGTHESER
jgi:hypothetical protein